MCYAACWEILGWTSVAADLKVAASEKINSRVETEQQTLSHKCTAMYEYKEFETSL